MKSRPIERVELGSSEAADRVRRGEPFTARVDWPAMQRWSPEYIRRTAAPKQVIIFEKTAEGADRIEIDISKYIDIVFDPRWAERYEQLGIPQTRLWFEGRPDPSLGALLDDIAYPSIVDRERLLSVNLWLGAGGFDNGNHYDPNGMNNLNVAVAGRKRWRLFHPRHAGALGLAPALASIAPPLVASETEHPDRCSDDDVTCFDVELAPGEAIFVPAFWMHWVTYGGEPTINVNFWWGPDQVPLTGISASWALVNALIRVMRQRMPGASFREVCDAIAALAPETRALVCDLERALASDPALLRSETALQLRRAEAGTLPVEGVEERFRDRR